MSTLVMKFGGSSVSSPENFLSIADIIIERAKVYSQIAVVVSAMGDTTDQLLELAKKVNPDPPRREQDMLVSVGERISIALLAMALSRKGRDAISFTGSQSGIITCAKHSEARIIDMRPHRIIAQLRMGKIVIVAGFQGVGLNGEITTLGRGGSDTTAVALAIALKAAKVEFYKDVSGIYSEDPKDNPSAVCFRKLDYNQASEIAKAGSGVLHPRCIDLARNNHIELHVLSYLEFNKEKNVDELGTKIGESRQPAQSSIYETAESEMKEGVCI